MRYSDDELLALVSEERKRSIGFGESDSGDLASNRAKAIEYSRGIMTDVPSMPNRSKAVSTDVADAVETVLPDLIEIFIGGEDVVAFRPVGEDDVAAAKQETDYTKHVVFEDNDGFLTFYSTIKDALLTKTGLFYWWWEASEEDVSESFVGKSPDEFMLAAQAAEQRGSMIEDVEQTEDGLISFKISEKKDTGKVCIASVPSEDFAVAQDTVRLKDATYCSMRDRPRAQDLIARGVDRKIVEELPSYGRPDEETSQARDTVGENDLNRAGGTGDLRVIEVVAHYIRLLDDDDQLCIYRVLTAGSETKLIEAEKVSAVPFGAITPFINPHRFHGESLYDKLGEIQRIKTALLRMLLDSGYFALNQRFEVASARSNEFTIADLLRNEPNVPVRSTTGDAVRAISAGGLNFDALAAIEHVSTMGEGRSGVVRNAQGLNPDTLHETAKGAMALMAAAQKRVRLIARILAETGVKDLYLGVHALIRQNASGPAQAMLNEEWVQLDPSQWAERKNMTVEVGLGASGREADMQASEAVLQLQERLWMLQGGEPGPWVSAQNVYVAGQRYIKATGAKTPGQLISDPEKAEPRPPKPDPEAQKVQAELQMKQAEMQMKGQEGQAKLQLSAQEGAQKAQMAEQQAVREYELAVAKMQAELQLKRETTAAELELKRELLVAELQMKREVAVMNAEVARETGMAKAQASGGTSGVEMGGEPG